MKKAFLILLALGGIFLAIQFLLPFLFPFILGALLALALAGWVSAALPWLMSAAAGGMVCVTAQEMIPEAVEQDEPTGVISVVLGFALMMALDIAL